MAGNRQAYEEAMNTGHSAAWDQEWQIAVASYGRAIQEFPNDAEAHIHLGLGLLELGRLEDALKVYNRARQLAPNDPIPVEKSADILERMGRLRDAAQQYVNVSEYYLSMRDLDKAIRNWERATKLSPGLIPVHIKLAQAYERIGDKRKAIREYLVLAYNFQRMGDYDKAIKAAQRALRIEPTNATVLNNLRALEAGGQILPPADDGAASTAPRSTGFEREAKKAQSAREQVGDADPLGPIGEAMTDALGMLAVYVIEGNAGAATGDALAAMEAQRQGSQNVQMYDQAIEAYQRAEKAGMKHPALYLTVGALLLQRGRAQEAIPFLNRAVEDTRLAPGALHGLGQAKYKLQKHREAARHLLSSLQLEDNSLSSNSAELVELDRLYSRLSEVLDSMSDEALMTVNKRFISLLEGKDWKQRIADTRVQLTETLRHQGERGVVDILMAERGERLTQSIALIERYMRQGLYTLAMDEAHYAVEVSPDYLPIHVRMAEIMMKEGRVRQAVNKFNIIAKTHLARGENDRARDILRNVLELAPLDVSVRRSLIELLEAEEKWDEALDQYIDLADTYHQLGDFDLSRDTYIHAERLASRVQAAPEKLVHIKHRIADIDQMRLDMRKAQRTYEEIIQIMPDDERAYRMLVDLNYRQGNQLEAIRKLDKLLSIYARQKQVNRITQLLEELVTLYPNDTQLRSRLASIYRQLGRKRDAIIQLDALGELQLEAGMHQEAANTIRQIISLEPEHVEDYRKLLSQLGG